METTTVCDPAAAFPEYQDMLKAVLTETDESETTELSEFSAFLQRQFCRLSLVNFWPFLLFVL